MQTIRVLADDLTGALDSAAQFTGQLGPVPVYLDLPTKIPPGHGALDAASRDVSRSEAVVAMRRLGAFLEANCAFRKIDSLLRGHWAAELAALLDGGCFRSAVLAPAFPDQGRVTREGIQCVRGPDGSVQPLAIDIVASLQDMGLNALRRQATGDGAVAGTGTIIIADAETAEDLAGIVTWGKTLPQPTLWIGSAGLARALAGTAPLRNVTVTKPLLGLIGSAHAVMREQIEQARRRHGIALCPVSQDVAGSARAIVQAFDDGRPAIVHFPLPDGLTSRAASERIAERIQTLLPLIPRFPTLLVAGGETLRAICIGSKADRLMAESEYSPGVPRSRIVGGRWRDQTVISKSGAFGKPDFLASLL